MRWNTINSAAPSSSDHSPEQQALFPLSETLPLAPTPDFKGITFHEVVAKSILNKVPGKSPMFPWTINPYRGCSHACVYCFARNSHTYLDFDAGEDFNNQVVVKVNAVELLRRELAKPSWNREHVAMGTNTDPYQRAEGRYKLMPGIIQALAASETPFSILTKGTLLSRDLPLLKEAAKRVRVSVGMSLALTDEALALTLEPGTPTPSARLNLLRKLTSAGISAHVMVMPVLPWITDSHETMLGLARALKEAGASRLTFGALHLKPGTKEWFMSWLAKTHPQLVPHYQRLYGRGIYAPKDYRTWLSERAREIKNEAGFGQRRTGELV